MDQFSSKLEIMIKNSSVGIGAIIVLIKAQEHHVNPGLSTTTEDVMFVPIVIKIGLSHDTTNGLPDRRHDFVKAGAANNVNDAFWEIVSFQPDLVLVDSANPQDDGFPLCEKLKCHAQTSHITVVVSSRKTDPAQEELGIKAGADLFAPQFLNTPYWTVQLQNMIKTRMRLKNSVKDKILRLPPKILVPSWDDDFIEQVIEVLNRRIDDPNLDVKQLSKELGISENSLYRKIKTSTNQTVKGLIHNHRIKTGACMLLQKRKTISEVCYMIGFSSPSYFSRRFKDTFGCTPSEYVKAHSA